MGILPLAAQTTQGLISGSIINSVTGKPIAGASVTYTSQTLAATGTLKSDTAGYYFLPLLSAGTYTIRTTADQYQSQELEQLELPVAGRVQIDFRLRPLSDVWEAGQFRSVFLPGSKTIVTFYGPDVDTSRSGTFEGQQGTRGTLDTSASYVIDPTQIGDLPLQGRDVYTMLVSLPGVTADNGTARGIGVSVTGARPSSSNFLLDGVENDNYLVTGPLNPVAPEAVQEYRISTNNYSAEYGRTSGFVANAVTKAGGQALHGIGYEYLKNEVLNAADFQDNLAGLGRRTDKENQFGYQVGGPVLPKLLRNRLFFSSALEGFISHSKLDPATYMLPTTNFLSTFNVPSSRLSYQLLTKYPGPALVSPTGNFKAPYTVAQPVVIDRLIALERGDYTLNGGRDHIMVRLNIARLLEPDFLWYVYPQFISPLNQHTEGVAGNWMHTWTPRLTSEFKLSYNDDDLYFNRAHPEVPILVSNDGVLLPGSQAQYSYKNHNQSPEAIYSMVWTRNRHIITAGAGFLFRFNSGYFRVLESGEFGFSTAFSFAVDQPFAMLATVNRLSPALTPADPDRSYRFTESYFFAQDSFRFSSRLTLNYGLRYERFGAPQNTGPVKDVLVELGPGGDFNSRLASATLSQNTGNQRIYGVDNSDFAPRAGFSYDVFGKAKTIVRGSYGMFYDRLFDNLWQNVFINATATPPGLTFAPGKMVNYLQPIATTLASFPNLTALQAASTPLILLDPKLRNGYVETAFLGVQQSLGENLTVEVDGTASRGRRLLTSDIVNRQFTLTTGSTGRPNENMGDIEWRSSQGNSDYSALTALVRYHLRTLQLQGAYTWSHAIDDQSDPFGREPVNLQFTTNGAGGSFKSAFAQQFNNQGDRGNSDFDQRQNLFLLGVWRPEARRLLMRGWQVSWLAAFRGGFPYTVLAPQSEVVSGTAAIENQRADLLNPGSVYLTNSLSAPGGKIVLNAAAFGIPGAGLVGNSGRNAFRGPGIYNLDVSLGRSFSVPRLGVLRIREGTRFTIRADAFNLLNHANLNNPDSLVGDPNFGLATYGRQGTASGFPAVSPVNETARQIQLLLRIEF
jgi:hypothetical protein